MAARFVYCVVAALAVGGLQVALGQYDCSQTDISAQAIEDCVNAVRTDPGRYAAAMCGADAPSGSLWPDSALTSAADFHNSDMAARGYFSHGDFGGRIRGAGFGGGEIGENLANGYTSAYSVVAGWMCSPGHRRNLMNCNYDSIGTAVDCASGMSGGCLVTQTYGCSTGYCCGGGGRGPAPAPSQAVAGEADIREAAPAPPSLGFFGSGNGLFSNIFGTPPPTPLPAPAEPVEAAAPPATSCLIPFLCNLFGN